MVIHKEKDAEHLNERATRKRSAKLSREIWTILPASYERHKTFGRYRTLANQRFALAEQAALASLTSELVDSSRLLICASAQSKSPFAKKRTITRMGNCPFFGGEGEICSVKSHSRLPSLGKLARQFSLLG